MGDYHRSVHTQWYRESLAGENAINVQLPWLALPFSVWDA